MFIFKKIFGVGPLGVAISLILLSLVWWIDRLFGRPSITVYSTLLKAIGILLVVIGIGIHLWALWTLRHWWIDNRLCKLGPFKYFRHPMYAAWITFIASGISLYLNSWIFLLWPISLQPIWHRLVIQEEKIMADIFGNEYNVYAQHTGRFIPRIF